MIIWPLFGQRVCCRVWLYLMKVGYGHTQRIIERVREGHLDPEVDGRTWFHSRARPIEDKIDAWFLWVYNNLAQDQPDGWEKMKR